MAKFLAYLRNDKGGAVEYVLVTAAVAGGLYTAATSTVTKNAINAMMQGVFTSASGKATY